jgi:hypothetical protein
MSCTGRTAHEPLARSWPRAKVWSWSGRPGCACAGRMGRWPWAGCQVMSLDVRGPGYRQILQIRQSRKRSGGSWQTVPYSARFLQPAERRATRSSSDAHLWRLARRVPRRIVRPCFQ